MGDGMAKRPINQHQNRSFIPRRLNILFFITFLVFIALFIRLGYLQLYHGETFNSIVEQTESTLSTGSVPRGMIYDSQGNVLVGNQPEQAILYTRDRASRVGSEDIVKTASQLASLIEYPITNVTERQLREYFFARNEDLVNSRLSREERQLSGGELYDVQLSKITEEEIQFDEAEMEIVALFNRMNAAYELSTITVKNQNVTEVEIARVSENLGNLPGITIGTDWQRVYPQGPMLRSIFGQVSSESRGLPRERANELLQRGYAMNDRVGISYLEQEYEDALRGTKSLYNIVTDADDDIQSSEELYAGKKGDNLVMTINMQLQQRVEEILENNLQNMGEHQGLNDRAYVVALDPNNGDVLAIAGKRYEYNTDADAYNTSEIVDDALGTINTSYGMGSSIKPAMVATGYMEDVIATENNELVDEPMKFAASEVKSSVFNRTGQVTIDDITALQVSSNVYMIKLAMLIGGQTSHVPDGPLTISPDTIDVIRGHLAEFGLGTKTGIDLPNESEGFSPHSDQLVNAIDLSYGQFDLYTPLQMAQFVSTIANGGIRYAPRLVNEIRGTDANGKLGGVKTSIPPKVMNVVPISQDALARIHEGMRRVSHTDQGTARYLFLNYPIEVGSKTGTTEAFYSGPIQYAKNRPVTNATYVGYAPFDEPEIAISVVVPYLDESSPGRESTVIAHEVMNAYFEIQAGTREMIQRYAPTATMVN